jgi:hypothetical protein
MKQVIVVHLYTSVFRIGFVFPAGEAEIGFPFPFVPDRWTLVLMGLLVGKNIHRAEQTGQSTLIPESSDSLRLNQLGGCLYHSPR